MNSSHILDTGLTHLWQITALIAFVAIVIRTVGRNRPHLAMALWLLVLVKCITPPVVFAPFGVFCRTVSTDAEVISTVGPVGAFVPAPGAPTGFDAQAIRPTPPVAASGKLPPEPAWEVADWLLLVWIIGIVIASAVSLLRLMVCLQRVRRSRVDVPEHAQLALQTLTENLGISRRVRFWVTSSAIGPAVIGLFRPTIVIPDVIAQNDRTALEPVLAHELIHIRRGDLWVSLLCLVSRMIWWFHPLVWWVGRQIDRETERACDEEVLAALGCRPADYARSLLSVLEQKNSLRAIPAFPGVRPVDITSQRMERIMSLRHGSRTGGGWRCRLLLVLGAALTLPGAVASQEPVGPPDTRASIPSQIEIKATVITAPPATIAKLVNDQPAKATAEAPLFGFAVDADVTGKAVGVVLVADEKPAAAPDRVTRLVSAQQAAQIAAAVKAAPEADVLLAPRMLCPSGQTATCSTNIASDPASGDRALKVIGGTTLKVTPRLLAKGTLDLSLDFQHSAKTEANAPARRKPAGELQTRVRLPAGQVLVSTLPTQDSERGTLLILEARPVQEFVPMAKRVPARPAAPRAIIVQAVILGSAPGEAKPPVAGGVKTTIPGIRTSHEPVQPLQALGTVAESAIPIPVQTLPPGANVDATLRTYGKGWEILSRPQVITLDGQPATVEVGSTEASLRLSLTPVCRPGNTIDLFGSFGVLDPEIHETTRFEGLSLKQQQTAILDFEREGAQIRLLLTARPAEPNKTPVRPARYRSPTPLPRPAAYAKEWKPIPAAAATRVPASFVTRTYPIADLTIPVPGARQQKPAAMADQLQELIQRAVDPESWNGQASLAFHEPTLSLVVRQTPEVHELLAGLLNALRQQQDKQIVVDVSLFSRTGTPGKKSLLVAREISVKPPVPRGIRLTLFNGRRTTLSVPCRLPSGGVVKLPIELALAVRPDGSVRTSFSVGGDGQVVNVDGNSEVLADVTTGARAALGDQAAKQQFRLFLKPRVIQVEEEEELILESDLLGR